MPLTAAQKLKLKEGFKLLTINAPADFRESLGELPLDVTISSTTKTYHQIHWFVKNKAALDAEVEKVVAMVKEDVVCWIYYPKGSSKIQTDLTRDKGWDALLKHDHLQWISLIAFDETWSVFGMRLKTDADEKRKAAATPRAIFNYINAETKTICLPNDFAEALKAQEMEKAFFDNLSFTNRKEYVEWIVTAQRAATRATRVRESVERLAKGWKNPANR